MLEKAREVGAHAPVGRRARSVRARAARPGLQGARGAARFGRPPRGGLLPDPHRASCRFPIIPPPLKNHGNYIISLNRFVKWLGGLVEAEGVDVFTGFPATELLYDGDQVVGVRTGDRGIGKHGEKKANFEPGVDIRAKVTISGRRGPRQPDEDAGQAAAARRRPGCRSSTRSASRSCGRCRRIAWRRARSIHTLGYPLKTEEFGGGFIYAMPDGMLSIGLVDGPELPRSDVRSAPGVPAPQAAPVCRLAARRAGIWSAMAPRPCPRAAGTRSRASMRAVC